MLDQPHRAICSHNEWDPLREVIVGTVDRTHAVLTWTHPEPPSAAALTEAYTLAQEAYPAWLLEECAEDLDVLATTLTGFGVTVHRPTVHNLAHMSATPHWQSTGNNLYNVRDLHLVVGNTVIESPSHIHSRQFEAWALHDIWHAYFEHGFRWIAAPKPRLDVPVLEPYYRDGENRILSPEDRQHMALTGGRVETLHRMTEREIVFEAANTLRMGRDLLYLVSSSGNRKGARWLQSVLGDTYRVHTTDAIYRSSHIDSTAMCLKPGLVLLNSTRVNTQNCPAIFDRWDKIYFSEVAPTSPEELALQRDLRDPLAKRIEALGFQTNLGDMSSPWVGMNVLSVNPTTVLVESRQHDLMRVLEAHGFTVVPIPMRHMYTQLGGLHCSTLDTVREGTLESYFD